MTIPQRRRWPLVLGAATVVALLSGCTIASISPIAGGQTKSSYDVVLAWLLSTVIFLANFSGGLVVGVATLRALLLYVTSLVRRHGGEVPKEAIRLSLGRSLALALEFQVGADILGTALNPTLQDIGTLAGIVVLRTALNYFLGRELREAESRGQER